MRPLQEQTWESFSRELGRRRRAGVPLDPPALRRPLAPGSTVIVMSSGAAVNGSPLSGGYAGAKAAVKFIADYAAAESERAGLGIHFVSVLPRLTPATELGAKAVAAYADRQGVDVDTFIRPAGPALTPEQVGRSVLEIAGGDARRTAPTSSPPRACRQWPDQLKTKGGQHHEHTPDRVGTGMDGRAPAAAGEGEGSDARP